MIPMVSDDVVIRHHRGAGPIAIDLCVRLKINNAHDAGVWILVGFEKKPPVCLASPMAHNNNLHLFCFRRSSTTSVLLKHPCPHPSWSLQGFRSLGFQAFVVNML